MNSRNSIALITVSLLATACTAIGPADDGFTNSQESLSTGRLFSDDETGYTVYKSRDSKATEKSSTSTATPAGSDQASPADFEEWQRARDNNSPEYQKFRLWQEFENFQRWQEDQQAKD